MQLKNKRIRGATLAELAIVIAVIAIVAVMVTSFIVMIDGSRDISQMKLDAMQDIRLAESIIEGFIEDAVDDAAKNSINPSAFITYSDNRLMKKNGDVLTFSNGSLIVTNNIVLELETVKKISFSALVYVTDGDEKGLPDNTVDNIYYCTITYDIGGTEFDYTFCVNPYAGEKIGG